MPRLLRAGLRVSSRRRGRVLLSTYTERDGKRAQRELGNAQARLRQLSEEAASDPIGTSNSELATRPGLEGAERIWRGVIVAIGMAALIPAYFSVGLSRGSAGERSDARGGGSADEARRARR